MPQMPPAGKRLGRFHPRHSIQACHCRLELIARRLEAAHAVSGSRISTALGGYDVTRLFHAISEVSNAIWVVYNRALAKERA
jgi:hypothetical protein